METQGKQHILISVIRSQTNGNALTICNKHWLFYLSLLTFCSRTESLTALPCILWYTLGLHSSHRFPQTWPAVMFFYLLLCSVKFRNACLPFLQRRFAGFPKFLELYQLWPLRGLALLRRHPQRPRHTWRDYNLWRLEPRAATFSW